MQPLLTISVLISRNYEGVKRCLDSLRPILANVSSELILTDTGCGKEVRDLIEEYTDHIIDFKWVDDFSAARNAGLREAKGEWFLYVDDDEWFDDVSELVEFFNSRECDKYNVAFYVQRNYIDDKGIDYKDHNVDRIIRNVSGLHFEGRVHEAYTGVDIGQKKSLKTFVHHYGYVYKNQEEKEAKNNRNRKLLELECQDRPGDLRLKHQLVGVYKASGMYDKALQEAKDAIKIKDNSEYWDILHTDILDCYKSMKDWDSIIKEGEKFLLDNLYPYDEFGVKQYMICAYWSRRQFDKICKLAPGVIDTYIDYKKNPDKYNANQLMIDEFWQEDNISKMLLFIIDSALAMENVGTIDRLLTQDVRKELMLLIHNDTYKAWLIQMVTGTCEEASQIGLFMRLSIAGDINSVKTEVFVNQIDNMFPYISLDKFDLWNEWICSRLEEGSDKEVYFLVKCYDYKLRSINYHIANMDEYGRLEFVLGLITGYADREMAYCKAKYKDKLQAMTEDELLPEEKLAWKIQELVNYVDEGNASLAASTVKDMLAIAPYWSEAIGFLPTYIQLVLG